MTRNIKIYLFIEAILAASGGFILPVYVLYFRYYNVTFFQVALLAAVFEASVLVFEIPTGLLADRFGRKASVITGFFLFAASGGVFVLYREFNGFVIAEILFGLAEAFISGAGEALAIDSIAPVEKRAAYNRIFTLRSRIRIAVMAGAMLLAGYVFSHNIDITFWPILAGGVIGMSVSILFRSVAADSGTERNERPGFIEPLGLVFRQLKGAPILTAIFIVALAANFAYEGADQYWQILGSEWYDIDIDYFGYITAAGAVISFLLVGPVTRRFSGNPGFAMMLLMILGAIISSLPNMPFAWLVPFLLVLYFAGRELIKPIFSVAINEHIGNDGRATFLSGYNMMCSVGEVASGLIVGWIASRLGLPLVFIFCGGMLIVFVLAALFLLPKH